MGLFDDVLKPSSVQNQDNTTQPAQPEQATSSGMFDDILKPKDRTIGSVAKDVGITALKGAISLPEAAVGVADIFSGGEAGKALEGIGFRPKEAKAILDEGYSEKQKLANAKLQNAEGFVDTVATAVQNPSTIVNAAIESAPLILGGGVVGAGARALKASPVIAGAIGEGVVGAGLAAEGTRQQTEDGLLTDKQAALSALSGVGTAVLGAAGGKLAQKLGITDIDTAVTGAVGEASKDGLIKRTVKGALGEGVFEELPQSVQEQVLSNAALDKPLFEGVDNAAAMGMLTGGVMGGGISAINPGNKPAADNTPAPDTANQQQEDAANAAPLDDFEEFKQQSEATIEQRKVAAGIKKPAENIDAADILGDSNVNDTANAAADVVTAAGDVTSDNVQGSVADLPNQSNAGGDTGRVDNVTGMPAQSSGSNVPAGNAGTGNDAVNTPLESNTSWVLREKETGKAILETTDKAKVDALNTEKYEAVPILQHLQELNQSGSKARNSMQANNGIADNVEVVNITQERVDKNANSVQVKQTVLQNRDRSQPESINQMRSISANPDPSRLSFSRDAANGAPVVAGELPASAVLGKLDHALTANNRKLPMQYAVVEASDVIASHDVNGIPIAEYGNNGKLQAIGGNGRIAGLQEAYRNSNGSNYAQGIAEDSALHGVPAEAIKGMKNPVLIRVMNNSDITPTIGDELNGRTNMGLSVLEQAKTDTARLKLEALDFNENGEVTQDAIKAFVLAMPENERNELMDGGRVGRKAEERLMAAIFSQAYNDDELVRIYSQAQDVESKAVINALAIAAPAMARLTDAGNLDIRSIVADAAKVAVNSSREGVSLTKLAAQGDLELGNDVMAVVRFMAQNIRRPKLIGEELTKAAQFAYDTANQSTMAMFDLPNITRDDIIRKVANDYQGSEENLGEQGRGQPDGSNVRDEAIEGRGQTDTQAAESLELTGQTNEDINAGIAAQEAEAKAQQDKARADKAEQDAKNKADIESKLKEAAANPDNFTFGEGSKDVKKVEVDLFNPTQSLTTPQFEEKQDAYKLTFDQWLENRFNSNEYSSAYLNKANGDKRQAMINSATGDPDGSTEAMALSVYNKEVINTPRDKKIPLPVYDQLSKEVQADLLKYNFGLEGDLNQRNSQSAITLGKEREEKSKPYQDALDSVNAELKKQEGKPANATFNNLLKRQGALKNALIEVQQGKEPDKRLIKQSQATEEQTKDQETDTQPEAKTQAKADLDAALGDLGNIFGKTYRADITPEQEQKIIPVLTRVFDAAFRLGYYEFKAAAKFVMDTIRTKIGSDVADLVTLDYLQGAYISMAGKYKDQATSKKDVVNVESLEELQGNSNVTNERSSTDLERDSGNAGTSNEVGAESIQAGREGNGRTGRSGVQGTETESGSGSSEIVPNSETISIGEQSNIEVQTGQSPSDASIARDSINRGSGDSGITGQPIEPEAAERIDEVAQGGLFEVEARRDQKAADAIPQELSIENIRETLPILKTGQQEDVLKAETRFAEPEGFGMLFTNGTGTGKTFTGLGIIKRFANRGKTNVLVVAPNDKIIEDWQKSGKLLGLNLNRLDSTTDSGTGIIITTYANMGANQSLADRNWDLVVHDEAHYLAMDKDGTNTNALKTLRAITKHPDGAYTRHQMMYRTEYANQKNLRDQLQVTIDKGRSNLLSDKEAEANDKENDRLSLLLEEGYESLRATTKIVQDDVKESQGLQRPRALFLSATPFAYEKTVDWANGYLFDYNEGQANDQTESRGYNSGSNRERFMMQQFGYRMRYNKLTAPDAKVNSGLMQRQFNTFLKKKGSLSGRMLDVDADYDRKFILVDSAIGARIDEALQWFEEKRKAIGESPLGSKDPRKAALYDVQKLISEKFDYLSRRYLLESIKAREVITHVKEHMAIGRKVVVFHDYKKGGGFNPFDLQELSDSDLQETQAKVEDINQVIQEFRAEFKDLINSPEFKSTSPIDAFKKEFPSVLLFNGDVPAKKRRENVATFNDDNNGPQVILVQSAAGKEGISLHDTTGKHQRVLFNLGQPTQPTTSIQQEGRIYRTGQVTDAIFRYLNTGTNWERWAFARDVANRASAAENLALGEQARALKDAFISAFEESDDYRAGMEMEGKGGKERDKAANEALTEYDRAKAFYYGTQKKTSKTKAQEGADYFATPEPVGLKMIELADIRAGEKVLEPSAGHGAIARWMPEGSEKFAIEPSSALRPRLAMVFDGNIISSDFEDLNIVNKFDAIVMNPPFGSAGRTAIDHVIKASNHLKDGGRIVALIPVGSTDKKFDKWFYETETRALKPVGTVGNLGDIYKGDTLNVNSKYTPDKLKVVKVKDGFIYAKEDGSSAEYLIPESSIKNVERTGARTEEYNPSKGLSLVAEIKLPSVTFERAGTAVNTRIVVIEKSDNAPQQTNRDYTQVTDINDLFDRMETLSIPERAVANNQDAAVTETKPAAQTKPALESVSGDFDIKTAQFEHSRTKETMYVAALGKRLEREEYDKVNAIAKANGGYYSAFKGAGAIQGFLFKSEEARQAFISALNQDSGDAPKFSRNNNSPIFYSALSRAITDIKIGKANSSTWKGMIKNLAQKGVKPDEIEWTGLNEWLDMQEGQVTKEQVVDYLNSNGVQVTETMLGDKWRERVESRMEEINDEVTKLVEEFGIIPDLTGDAKVKYESLEKEFNDLDDRLRSAPEYVDETKYDKYTVAGGDNYKELLLTLPSKSKVDESLLSRLKINPVDYRGEERYYIEKDGDPNALPYVYYTQEEAQDALNRMVEIKPETYKSGHFDQKNILAHVRFDERVDADGNKVLFINEIQSDWGQEGKKKGFNSKISEEDAKKQYKEFSQSMFDKHGFDWLNKISVAEYEQEQRLNRLVEEAKGIKEKRGVQPAPFVTKTDAWVSLALKRMIRYAAENSFDKVALINGQQAADLYSLRKQVETVSAVDAGNGTWNISADSANGNTVMNEYAVPTDKVADYLGKEVAESLLKSEPSQFGVRKLTGQQLEIGGTGMAVFYDSIVPKVANDVLKKLGGGKVETLNVAKNGREGSAIRGEDIARAKKEGSITEQLGFTISPEMREKVLDGLPLFNRESNVAKGISKATIQTAVNNLRSTWKNAPEIIVVQDMNDPAIRKAVRDENDRQLSQGAQGQPEAFFDNGKVYIVASEMNSANDVIRVVFHEALGHYGLRGLYGKDLGKVLDQVAMLRPREMKAKAKSYGLDLTKASDKNIAAEEILAEMAQTAPNAGLVKRAIAAIRSFLRNAGVKLELSDNDIIVNYLLPARGFVVNGRSLQGAGSLVSAFSRDSDQTNTPQFKAWFGNSKVVDKLGNPLEVFHGSPDARFVKEDGTFKSLNERYGQSGGERAFWFASSRQVANTYADDRRAFDYQKAEAGIVPAYLSIQNPLIVDGGGKVWREAQAIGKTRTVIEKAQEDGHDGVIIKNVKDDYNSNATSSRVTDTYVVFSSNQIKSSTDNNGDFDAANPDIRFSRSNPQQSLTPAWNAPETSKLDSIVYALQDKHVDLKRVTQAIKAVGTEISDRWNAYLQEELYHGRTAKRTQDFIKNDLNPLIEDMRMRGVAMADFEEFLWARHAEERNIQIAKVNPKMPDSGSGMSTKDARDYLANLSPANKAKYEALAKRVDGINRKSRQVLLDYGLESADTIAAWEGAYKNYVPLMREDMDAGFGNGTGQGFSVKGNASKRATGSNRAVVDIIANIAQQYEKNVIRGEKNRVSTALIGLAKLNPNEEFWEVDTPPTIKTIVKGGTVYDVLYNGNKAAEFTNKNAALNYINAKGITGYAVDERQAPDHVEYVTDPNYKNRDNVVVARIVNKLGKVEERSVVFSQFDERAMRMAASIKNLDQDQIGELLGTASSFTRYFASINTQYNPIFGVVNITRDIQGALLNLSTTPIADKKTEVLKNTPSALKGIYQDLRSQRKTGQAATNKWATLFEEFQNEGGQTGFRDMYRNAKERGEALKDALDPTWWKDSKIGKVISLNGTIANQEQWIYDKAIKPIFEWLEDYNSALENAVRLSVYKAALDNGHSKQQAASMAKNISVNFNRKGEMGRQIGSLYAFFNASVQGTARIGETMLNRDASGKLNLSTMGKRVIQGGLLLGAMQALMLAAAGFDDDEPPEFVKDRSLIIPIGDGKFITIPMPLGYNAIPSMGRIVTEWMLSGGKDTQKRLIHIVDMLLDVTNPIGNAGLSLQTITPTVIDPLSALAENKDFTGRPISREDFNSLNPTAGFTRSRDKAWDLSVAIARGINWVTGGTDVKQGAISPTADQLEYLAGQFTGGVGREIIKTGTTADSMVTGEELPTYKIPLVGRFYGDSTGQSSQGAAFYNNVRSLNEHQAEIKNIKEKGGEVAEYLADNPEAALYKTGDLALRQINSLRKRQRLLKENDADKESIKAIDERITAIMKKLNDSVKLAKEKEAS